MVVYIYVFILGTDSVCKDVRRMYIFVLLNWMKICFFLNFMLLVYGTVSHIPSGLCWSSIQLVANLFNDVTAMKK